MSGHEGEQHLKDEKKGGFSLSPSELSLNQSWNPDFIIVCFPRHHPYYSTKGVNAGVFLLVGYRTTINPFARDLDGT